MDEFVFSKHDDIGAAAAEDDTLFLKECFVDIGDIDVLLDTVNPKRIVVGRTGTGKSALLSELAARKDGIIPLSLQSLSLNFIANNNVIAFFEEAGVNLSLFYSLLWRHMLVVELLKKKFAITDEDAQKNYMSNIRKILYKKDKIKEQAVDYLENWGNKFWLTTEERVKELVDKIETSLSGSVEGKFPIVNAGVSAARSLTTEQRTEVVEIGRKVVSEIQIRELDNIINVLSENVFDDPQEKYFITIDSLDEEWVDDRIKLRLVRALIDTSRKLKKITNVKVIIAIRQDLLDRVIHFERQAGFQEEKYKSLYLDLRWTKDQLIELVQRRISALVCRRYTKKAVRFQDIAPNRIDNNGDVLGYLLARTFMRPRDIIEFVNECISVGVGKQSLSAADIKKAEEVYSHNRLHSLVTEWHEAYPCLECILHIFDGMKTSFQASELTRESLEEKYLEYISSAEMSNADPIVRQFNGIYAEQGGNFGSVRNFMLRQLYMIGFLGIKTSAGSSVSWSTTSRFSIAPGQIKPSSIVHIHPMFYRALDIDVR